MLATGSPRHTAEAGFTLLELLVAVGIMALAAGIAFPVLQHRLAARATEQAAATLRLALAEARGDSLMQGAPVTLTLSADGTLLAFGNGHPPLPLPDGHPPLDWPREGITFHPDGSARGGFATLGQGNRAQRFTVEPGDSHVTVFALAQEQP
jgi:prepilin-type N-terminal cleavage/methylation domain-containing protein